MDRSQALTAFLQQHKLPETYLATARQWFEPLAAALAKQRQRLGRPMLVGINGSQGSGKSTLAALLCLLLETDHGLRAIDLSLDDFYLTREQRRQLAEQIHPLLATRGVPGTHDVELMRNTLLALLNTTGTVPVPRFDKGRDERRDPRDWPRMEAPVDILLVEGWCFGTPPQADDRLAEPLNRLEREADPGAVWRGYVNRECARYQARIYALVDEWVMLRAPSFDCVYRWRLEQEQKLAERLRRSGGDASGVMDEAQLQDFIQHYQRLTEHALETLPARVQHLYRLDPERRISALEHPQPAVAGTGAA